MVLRLTHLTTLRGASILYSYSSIPLANMFSPSSISNKNLPIRVCTHAPAKIFTLLEGPGERDKVQSLLAGLLIGLCFSLVLCEHVTHCHHHLLHVI